MQVWLPSPSSFALTFVKPHYFLGGFLAILNVHQLLCLYVPLLLAFS